jgi:hypothetical protein
VAAVPEAASFLVRRNASTINRLPATAKPEIYSYFNDVITFDVPRIWRISLTFGIRAAGRSSEQDGRRPPLIDL